MITARMILTLLALAIAALALFILLLSVMSERIWQRLGRIALRWWKWRDRRNT